MKSGAAPVKTNILFAFTGAPFAKFQGALIK
jgi:hypothetical protein